MDKPGLLFWVLYLVQCLFFFGGLVLLYGWWRHRDLGRLLASITLIVASVASSTLFAWWPLAVGFAMLWVYRLLGLDPDAPKNNARP